MGHYARLPCCCNRSMLVMIAGLPGTGKSTVAAQLAKTPGGVIVSKDVIRHALFGPNRVEYSSEQDDFCLEIMLQTAAYLLRRNPNELVILDGRTFSRQYQRDRVLQTGFPCKVVECVCSEATAIARIERDAFLHSHPAQNRDAALYHRVKSAYQPIQEPKLVVDTGQPIPESLYSNFRVS